jgi:DNA-binding CsgD family transcriptional regulator
MIQAWGDLKAVPCQDGPADPDSEEPAMPDASQDDRAAIIAVIEAETEAWVRRDLDGWAECWVQADYVRRISGQARRGATTINGFLANHAQIAALMARYPATPEGLFIVRRENWAIRVSGDLAWVAFDQFTAMTGDPTNMPGLHYHSRILERHEGRWRIAGLFEVQTRLGFYTCPWVRVDRSARVINASPSARELLRNHRALSIRGDHLCGRSAPDTALLHAKLTETADKLARNVIEETIPIVFDHTEDGSPFLCWMSMADAMLVVLFDDEDLLHRTLDRARHVYGLPAGQIRVARQIARGLDLNQTAAALGTRPSTVRTHVRRMFDKVGVSSQAALIHALMSVEAPRPS